MNEVRFGFNRINITFAPNAPLNPQDYGINDGVASAMGLPQITINGVGLNLAPLQLPAGGAPTPLVESDSASYLTGAHNFKSGGEWRRFSNANFTSDAGTFQFPNLAGFQTGVGNSFTITLGDRPSDIIQKAVGLVVRDAIRAGSQLTLEVGLRYDRAVAHLKRQRGTADRRHARRDGRILRLEGRSPADRAQHQSVRGGRAAVRDVIGVEPHFCLVRCSGTSRKSTASATGGSGSARQVQFAAKVLF